MISLLDLFKNICYNKSIKNKTTKGENKMPTTANIQPAWNRYGRNGWNVFCVGFDTMWFRTMKLAKEWANSHGLDLVK